MTKEVVTILIHKDIKHTDKMNSEWICIRTSFY